VSPIRALLALALAAATTVALVAGPALSLEPWRPEPVDFELAAVDGSATGAGAARRGRVVSAALRTPKRFNLVGLRWRGRAEPRVAMRARLGDGRWTPWKALRTDADHAPDPGSGERTRGGSDPLWVGEADTVQYRISRRVPGLRLHFVNVKGTATAADRLRTRVRSAVNGAVLAALGPSDAHAQEAQPAIVPREEWGAEDCPPRSGPEFGEVKAAFVHHTVTANNYTEEEAPQLVLGICRFHRNSNGWNDVGYNFLVDKYGNLYEGRAGGVDRPVMGAQTQGYNAQSTGISNIGTHTSVPQTDEALEAMARLIRWKLPLHGTPTSGSTVLTSAGGASNKFPTGSQVRVKRVSGHRDTNSTECPGGALYDQLPDLRALVGSLAPDPNATRTTAALAPRRVDYGEEALIEGEVRAAATGAPLATVPVEVQRRGNDGRWRRVADVVTDGSGLYTASFAPQSNRLVRARYPGDGTLRPSASGQRLLGVRPLVTIKRRARRGRAGRVVKLSGTVTPRKRFLHLVVQHRSDGRWRRPGVRVVRARKGKFATYFLPGRTGRWRFYVVSKADAKTLRSASERYEVRVRP
jgi:hypothetical protein